MRTAPRRLTLVLAAAAALALPGAAAAAGPTPPPAPPAPVVDWQTHLAHMRAMDANLGMHLVETCIAQHGSLAQKLGPNGAMVLMMGEMVR
jgi:hypothetical protein